MQGLIIENISNLYRIKSGNKIYEATPRGKLKKEDISPVVGKKSSNRRNITKRKLYKKTQNEQS